jgi:hypothetical protein
MSGCDAVGGSSTGAWLGWAGADRCHAEDTGAAICRCFRLTRAARETSTSKVLSCVGTAWSGVTIHWDVGHLVQFSTRYEAGRRVPIKL